MRKSLIGGLTAVLVIVAPCRAGSYAYTPLNVPGAANTLPGEINNAGVVVGSTFGLAGPGGFVESFIYSGGNFTPYNVPGAFPGTTVLYGINNLGQLVGSYATPTQYGFFDDGTTIHQISPPGATGGTIAISVNDHGEVVGLGFPTLGNPGSFAYQNGNYLPIADPNGVTTYALGVNNAGTIVGYYTDANNAAHGFILQNGQYTTLDVPGAGTGSSQGTFLGNINNNGELIGSYTDSSGNEFGFDYKNGKYTILNDPLAVGGTLPSGINDQGQIVGSFSDATGAFQGFLATPGTPAVPEPAGLTLLAVAGLAWTGRRLFKAA
jgi:probable HAF family extracellular repeat protein